jgi:RsiW-degrading membrane proteinase PrsW (M82 family)
MSTNPADHERTRNRVGLALWATGVLVGVVCILIIYLVQPLFLPNPGETYKAMFLGAVVSVPACLVYMVVPILVDRYDPEPWWLLAMAVVWGAVVACGFSGMLNQTIEHLLIAMGGKGGAKAFCSVVIAPFVEESFKGAFVLGMLWFMRREFDGVVDGVIYATFTALGFAAMENVLYFAQATNRHGVYTTTAFLNVFFVRLVLTPWTHPLFTSMTGLGVGLSRESVSSSGRFVSPVVGFGVAYALHATWNGAIALGDALGWPIANVMLPIWFLMGACFGVLLILLVRREGQTIRQNLLDEVAMGNLTGEELELVCSPFGRIKVIFGANGAKAKRFVDAASKLGLAKWHVARANQGKKSTYSVDFLVPLRQELAGLRAEMRR